MKLADIARVTALISRISRDPYSSKPHGAVDERRDQVAPRTGTRYDLYTPRGPLRGAVVAVHGMTPVGGRDPRLIHFARCLARSRVACVAPTLAGMVDCQMAPSDVDGLVEVTAAAADIFGLSPGIIGFSYGGSYALLAAARPALAPRIRYVVSFGAYHCLRDLIDGYVANQHTQPTTDAEWDDFIYLRLVLAYQRRERISNELQAEVTALLRRSCNESSIPEKKRFYRRHLQGRDIIDTAAREYDDDTIRLLSPRGNLADLDCRVSLIHDARDSIVPPAHGERLSAELRSNHDDGRYNLLITTLLSHVNLGNLLDLGELKRFYSVLSPIIEIS